MDIKTGGGVIKTDLEPNADNGDVAATRVPVRVSPRDESLIGDPGFRKWGPTALGPKTAPDRLVH